jgi:uncharacterized membrane protein
MYKVARTVAGVTWIVLTVVFALTGMWTALSWLGLVGGATSLVVWYRDEPAFFHKPVRLRRRQS